MLKYGSLGSEHAIQPINVANGVVDGHFNTTEPAGIDAFWSAYACWSV